MALRGFVITLFIAPRDESTWIEYKVQSGMQASVGASRYLEHNELVTYLQEDLYNVGKKIHLIIWCLKKEQKLHMTNYFQPPRSLHSAQMFVHM